MLHDDSRSGKNARISKFGIKVTCDDARPVFVDVGHARHLAAELRRVGEADLAKRIELAVDVVGKQVRPSAG